MRTPDGALRILILGGTGFLGPHIVEAATRRGHRVTLFNRRRTFPERSSEVETLEGDRDPELGQGLTALGGRRWDAVIDTSGYVPRLVLASATQLAEQVRHYLFISSIAVYAHPRELGLTEEHPVAESVDPDVEAITTPTYGPLKGACERALDTAFDGRVTHLRSGYMVGPRDPFGRLTYWVQRVARGGEALAPGTPEDPVQYIDVRDVADFAIGCLEAGLVGAYNLVGPASPTTIGDLLYGTKRALGSDIRFRWLDAEFLVERGARFPGWIWPDGPTRGYAAISNHKALEAGLSLRPLALTVKATKSWLDRESPDPGSKLRSQLDHRFEPSLLDSWKRWRSARHDRHVRGCMSSTPSRHLTPS